MNSDTALAIDPFPQRFGSTLLSILKDKRLLLAIILLGTVAVIFWSTSRVPQLNEKAMMGGEANISTISFDVVLPVLAEDPLWRQIAHGTVNWIQTNKKGMTFGIIFGACMMVLLSLMRRRSFESGFANSFLGMVVGAPLGVCVNCAAPIAQGLHSAGARAETTLAAMVSSPSLNIIVLTMLFALFPPYLVGLKLGATFVFVLVFIPILIRIMGHDVKAPASDDACPIPDALATKAPEGEGWFGAGYWVAEHFFQNFWYIVVRTVPLMFVAGLLGTAVIVTMPFDALGDMFPVGNKMLVLMSMAFVALVGILLPVPIAFDVVIVAILLAGGLAPRYAMVLLFTLGIFSIYSFFVVWQGISKKIAVMMMVGAAGVGVVAGVAADQLYKRDLAHRSAVFYETFGETAKTRGPTTYTVDTGEHREAELGDPLPREAWESSTAEVAIERILNAPPSPLAEPRFTRLEGKDIGFNEAHSFSAMYYLTFSRFRAVASGDVHNDGFPDVLLATENGVALYANEGGKQFAKQTIRVPSMEEYYTVNSALVDMNNDGWLDIVFAAYGDGVFVIYNDHGNFAAENMQPIPNHDKALMPGAMSFGDIDEDGDLDVFFGNWSVGSMGQNPQERGTVEMSRNALVINHGDHFEVSSIDGWVGETLSSILTDINADGHLDLIVGNDFQPNDDYYFGDGTGNFKRIFRSDDLIEHTGFSTMSIATADVDNDLSPEIYVAQITAREGNSPIELVPASNQVCEEMQNPQYMDHCQTVMAFHEHMADGLKSINLDKALEVDPEMREDAIAVMLFHTAVKWNRNSSMIELFGEKWERFATAARATFSPRVPQPTPEEMATGLKNPTALENILLTRTEDGRYVDVASEFNLLQGGWTWNAKFADLTNDGYQDIYMVNGEITSGMRERKFFYENVDGERFVEKTKEYGFGSLLATSAYTYLDMDNDGDLDIVSAPAIGPLLIYRNNLNEGNSIGFELRDHQGNHFGIGSKITIRYDGGQQMRELQASGGFASFDAPIAHFGLGQVDEVSSVEIDWSRGNRTVVEGPFASGARYIVTRPGGSAASSEVGVSAGL